jgi:hypothetical protein
LEAQTNLAYLYVEGLGVPQSHAEAVKWYRAAAHLGHPEAQCNLGMHYARGEGVPQDYLVGYMWAGLARSQGLQQAAELQSSLAHDIVSTELHDRE